MTKMQSYTKPVHLLLALALVLSAGFASLIPQTAHAQTEADLSVTKIVDQAAPHSDHTITYTITLTNNGPDTATNIMVTDLLPSGVTYVSSSPSQGSYANSTGLWSVGSLANSGSATLTISAHVDAVPHGTVVTNTASVTSVDQADPTPANNSDSVNITIQNMCNDLTNCDWSTFSCTANDVNIVRLWLGDVAGVELGSCTPDTTVTAYVWAEFLNGTQRDTTAIWACFDFWINGLYIQSVSQCEGTVTPGAVSKMIWGPISWECGHQVTLKNMVLSWEGPGGICADVPNCGTRKSKCYGPVGLDVVGPLVADFTYTPDTPMCPGTTIQFTDTSFGGVPDAGFDYQYYLWDFGDGDTSTDKDPTHAFDEGGTHNVSLTVTDYDTPAESHTKSKPVEVLYSPAVTASNDGPACVGGDVQFTGGASLGTAPYIWSWSGPDSFSSSDQSPLLTGVTVAKAGTYTLTVTDDTGCSGNNTTEVVVNDNPTAGITPDPAVACEGVGLSLDGNPAGGSGTYTNHAWTGAGAAYLNNTGIEEPVFTCGTEGTYSLTYTVTDDNGCIGSDTITVTVNVNPGVTASNDGPKCEGLNVQLSASPSGGSGSYSYNWSGPGDFSSIDQYPVLYSVTTADSGDYTVTVTDSNGCQGSDTTNVEVYDYTDLAVTKTVDDPAPNEGDPITYTVTLTNIEPCMATNIIITDQLPTGITYSGSSPDQGTYTSGSGIWDVGSLASGTSVTLTIDATVNAGTRGTTIINSASITGVDQADPNPSNNYDSASITVEGADLAVSKIVDNASPNEGDPITYTITLTNNGPTSATNIIITDQLPTDVTYASHSTATGTYNDNTGIWNVGSLNNGASATLTINATVNTGTATQTITNTASVTSVDQGDPNPANNSDSASITVIGADLAVSKTVDDPAPNEGDTITYTITLTNNGPDAATNIIITDLLPSGVTYSADTPSQGSYNSISGQWSAGSLAFLASATLDIDATVDPATAAQTITNTASVTAVDQVDPTPANNSDSASITVQAADLEVTKTVDDPNPNEDDTITYTITLTNKGPDNATNIIVTDLLPLGLTYSSHSATHGAYDSGSGQWSVGSLANAASATLDISASVDPGTATYTITNTAELTAVDQADLDSTPNNNQPAEDDQYSADITVQGADLSIIKDVDNTYANEGDTITYTITLTNNGLDTATNIIVTDSLPSGVTYASDIPSQGSYTSISGQWSVGSLANGASATLSITATVNTGTTGQTIINTASITSVDQADPNPANNSDSAAFTVGRADLTITKDVDNPTPDEATSVTYTVTITNNGPTAATNIVVTDLLPSGVTYSSDSPSQGTYSDFTGQWNVGSLANTASATLDITAVVNTGTGGQTITNTAIITAADQDDPIPANNTDSADITVNTYPPQVTTNAATSVAPNSATLNGDLTNMGTDPSVDVSFDWTTDAVYIASGGNYDHNTGPWTVLSTGPFSFNLPGLSSYTMYHFRAKAVGHGTAWGADLTFTTDPAQPTQPPSVNPIQGAPCVALPVTLESALFNDPDPGDYHVASQWQVRTSAGSYASPAFDSGRDTINLTDITLTSSELDHDTTYFWHVRHQDSHGLWSNWSMEAYFRTADTPVGEPTEITPDGTDISFSEVNWDGCTYVTRSNVTPADHSEPVIPRIGPFTDITTTATYTGTITVGLPYESTRGYYQGSPLEVLTDIRLFHWNGTQWEDITTWTDAGNNIVYGDTTSLSWFYIGGEWVYIGPSVPAFPNIYIGIAAAFGAAILGYFIRRRVIIQN